ncbi:Pericentriolar material 1 protein-like [Oopsacas minuta]|uniref:Pericentriolar material 1 protein-like n=1 Tax=Oopsacas minuta TaxID=111878 RepID=A0AAV7KL87_9METZ|nr:Pericentriolar material 1 protein-like [Oopsacas minuta]
MYTPTYYPPVHYCTTPHCITPQPFPLFCHSLPIAPYHQTAPPPPPVPLSYPTPTPYHQTAPPPPVPLSYPSPTPYHQTAPHPPPVPLSYPTPTPYHQTAPHPPPVPLSYPTPTPYHQTAPPAPPVPLSYPTPTPYHQTAPHPPPVPLSYPTPTPYHQTAPHPPPVPLSYPTPTPPAFYPSSVHCNMYQSLPIPCPCPGPGPGPGPAIHPVNQWIQQPYVPKTASCTQTDLTFSDNPLSSQHRLSSARDNPSRRELSPIPSYRQQQQEDNVEVDCSLLLPAAPGRRSAPFTSTNSQKRFSPGLESPSFDQVREEIYSEVASLISENETRLYHMLKFLRAVRSLNTDYLVQCGLSSLNHVINNFQNPDVIDFEALRTAISDEDDISEVTAYPSEGDFEEGVVSAWQQQVYTLVSLLIRFLRKHLDECCEAELLQLIYRHIEDLLSELFPEEIALRLWRVVDLDVQAILSRYATEKLRDCIEDLLVELSGLFSLQDVMYIALSNSLQQQQQQQQQQQLSYESEDGEGCERDIRDQARDDALASVTQNTPPQVATEAENVTDKSSKSIAIVIERS